MGAALINVHRWCGDRAAGFREKEQAERSLFMTPDARDAALVEWVVKGLGDPGCEDARKLVVLLAEQHGARVLAVGDGSGQ